MVTKFQKQLDEWVSNGIIDAQQAERIAGFERSKPSRSWVLSGVLMVGALAIGIGVVSLIAANWDEIPGMAKLAIDFLILAGLGCGIFVAQKNNRPVLFDTLLFLYFLLCLASIGLISQVYHTGGKLSHALLFWTIITLPSVLTARHLLVPFLWALAWLTSLTVWGSEFKWVQSTFGRNQEMFFLSVPFVSYLVAIFFQRFKIAARIVHSLRVLSISGVVIGVQVAEVGLRHSHGDELSHGTLIFIGLGLLSILAVVYDSTFRHVQKIVVSAALGVFLVQSLVSNDTRRWFELPSLILTLCFLSLTAVYFVSEERRRLFQFTLVCVGLKLLHIYFIAFGGLASTGIGLIVAGGLVIAFAVTFNKYNEKISNGLQRWLKYEK